VLPRKPQRQRDVAFILNKLADLDTLKKDWKTALDRYTTGLKIAEANAARYPIEVATQKSRIAQLLSDRGEPGDAQQALAKYREALAIQTSLLQDDPDSPTLLSNAALTHRRIGGLLKDDRPDEAKPEYAAAVEMRKKLYERDPGILPWRIGLAADYKLLGDTLLELKDFRGALQNNGPDDLKRWILDPVHGLHNLIYLQIYTYRRLDELGDNLRNGRPTMDVHQKASEPSWYQEIYTRAMREAARMIIPSLIKQITLPPSAKRMLDIGGAHGEYSRAMARKFPGLKPTVFDLGGPISTAQDIINQEGNAAGLELKVGNCLLDDFGPGWDAILMVNMVHLFDREQNLNLFRKAKASLNPGGKILTVDQYVGVSKFRDRVFALVSLNFYNVGGKSYPVSEMHELLTEAGFTNIKLRPLGYTVPAALIEATA